MVKENRRLLITGGSGFLGGYLVLAALQGPWDVCATYFAHRPDFSRARWYPLDLNRPAQIVSLLQTVKPDVVVHTAALTNVDYCETHREEAERTNIQGSRILAQETARLGARLIYISTDLVFDGGSPPYSENGRPNPLSFYGWSKWQGELAVQKAGGCFVIVRPSILFGPPALLGTSFTEWMLSSWRRGKKTPLFTDQFRTPIWGRNLAEAVLEVALLEYTGILHIGGADRISRYEFGLKMAGLLGISHDRILPAKMADVNLAGPRPADVSLNTSLARRMLRTRLLPAEEGLRMAYAEII